MRNTAKTIYKSENRVKKGLTCWIGMGCGSSWWVLSRASRLAIFVALHNKQHLGLHLGLVQGCQK